MCAEYMQPQLTFLALLPWGWALVWFDAVLKNIFFFTLHNFLKKFLEEDFRELSTIFNKNNDLQSPGSIPDLKKYWIKHFPLKKNIRKINCLKTSVQVRKNNCIELKIINKDLYISNICWLIFATHYYFPCYKNSPKKIIFTTAEFFFFNGGLL